jgi:hypothetical protein
MKNWEFKDEAEAISKIREALQRDPVEAFETFFDIAWAVRSEISSQHFGDTPSFTVTPKLRMLKAFMSDWQWFVNYGIEPEDFLDVIKGGLELLRQIFTLELELEPKNGTPLSGTTVPAEEEAGIMIFRDLPGYADWHANARKRFKEIKHSEKYKSLADDDWMGH